MHKKKWGLCVTNSDEENTIKKCRDWRRVEMNSVLKLIRNTEKTFWGENLGNFSSFETSEEAEESHESL